MSNTAQPKPIALGFAAAVAVPVTLGILATSIYPGGFTFIFSIFVSVPVALAFILVFGAPLYFLYCRLQITSAFAYVATGLALCVPIVTWLLWQESSNYENPNQALLQHTIELVCLLSGPAAAAIFWWIVRPDIIDVPASVESTSVPSAPVRRRYPKSAVIAVAFLAWIALVLYRTSTIKTPEGKTPLATATMAFDSARAPALISSLNVYVTCHRAHLGYYFMLAPVPENSKGATTNPPLVVVANIGFPDNIEITVMDSGVAHSGKDTLSAYIYSATNSSSRQSEQIWADFIAFLQPAVDHANTSSPDQLPDIAPIGEAGKIEAHWWDWRFPYRTGLPKTVSCPDKGD